MTDSEQTDLMNWLINCALGDQELRDALRILNTDCPECNTKQIELRDPRVPNYKCRECKHKWKGISPQ